MTPPIQRWAIQAAIWHLELLALTTEAGNPRLRPTIDRFEAALEGDPEPRDVHLARRILAISEAPANPRRY